uniref:Uncharacterized protein n=1 Tax=Knipowitschia caucasica TaxID=637954 RepID=A0AAV2MNG2_KNICA
MGVVGYGVGGRGCDKGGGEGDVGGGCGGGFDCFFLGVCFSLRGGDVLGGELEREVWGGGKILGCGYWCGVVGRGLRGGEGGGGGWGCGVYDVFGWGGLGVFVVYGWCLVGLVCLGGSC